MIPIILSLALTAPGDPPVRRVRVDEAEAARDLAALAARWTGLAPWEARRADVRRHMLSTMGLEPPPASTPLRPILSDPRDHDGYAVRNVAFEALPGFFVTGNLYLPDGGDGPRAGVLCPHGHFRPSETDGGGRFRPDMQLRCATLARAGAAVLAYDMVGWGESTQMEHDHPDALTLQTWSSVRAIDFLVEEAGVAAGRVAITGASGGGSQSFLLAALDERVTASVPVVMVSAHFFGGCLCESGKPIHAVAGLPSNNAEIAALAAPRPQLLISCGDDWTSNTPEVEGPFIRSIYGLYGADERLAHVHLADEGHDYGPSKRAPMYRFLARHLGLDLAAVTRLDGSIDESPVVIEPRETLLVFTDTCPRPAHALAGRESIMAALRGVPPGTPAAPLNDASAGPRPGGG